MTNPDRAPAFYKTLCTWTYNLLAKKLVPRHSYTPRNLYLDGKNTRHASLITVVCQDSAQNRRAFLVTTSIHSATPTNFIAGPLASIPLTENTELIPQTNDQMTIKILGKIVTFVTFIWTLIDILPADNSHLNQITFYDFYRRGISKKFVTH